MQYCSCTHMLPPETPPPPSCSLLDLPSDAVECVVLQAAGLPASAAPPTADLAAVAAAAAGTSQDWVWRVDDSSLEDAAAGSGANWRHIPPGGCSAAFPSLVLCPQAAARCLLWQRACSPHAAGPTVHAPTVHSPGEWPGDTWHLVPGVIQSLLVLSSLQLATTPSCHSRAANPHCPPQFTLSPPSTPLPHTPQASTQNWAWSPATAG
jgi:hypothetical protein